MRYLPPLMLPLALTACVTPTELMQSGERTEHTLTRPPTLAVACMSRNLDADRAALFGQSTIPATVRPLDNGGTELIVGEMFVAHALPDGTGSHVTIWVRPYWFYRKAELVPAMLKGC